MRRSSQLLLALFAALLIAAPAAAAKHTVPAGNAVLSDCDQHGVLSQHYTHTELSQALTRMPTWMKQYTTCQSVIQNALASGKVTVNGSGASNGGDGGGGSSSSTVVIIVIVIVVLVIAAFVGLLIRRRRRLSGAGSASDAPTRVIERDRPPADESDGGGDGGPAP